MELTKLGTDNKTRILDLPTPAGWTQLDFDRELTQAQSLRDAENMKSNRLCGGLMAPYLLPPSPVISENTKPRD